LDTGSELFRQPGLRGTSGRLHLLASSANIALNHGAAVEHILSKEQGNINLVFIYGPPAADKLGAATELAALTGYLVFHNHASIDFVKPIFAWDTPSFGQTVAVIRLLMVEEVVHLCRCRGPCSTRLRACVRGLRSAYLGAPASH